MPNWVINRIHITGPEDKIRDFENEVLDLSEGAESVFSFEKICPQPEELKFTISPDPIPVRKKIRTSEGVDMVLEEVPAFINDWEISRAIAAGEIPPEPIPCLNSTPTQQEELRRKYGASNWYGWNNSNWGTKWDCSDSTYNKEDKILQFSTAWSCPQAIIQKMALKFPDLDFSGSYADEDFGSNTGYIEDGEIYFLKDQSEEAYEIAATLWEIGGYFDDETNEWIFEED